MTPEDVWRQKSDEALVAASHRLEDYTDAGQRVIVAELERRRAAGTIDSALDTASRPTAMTVDADAGDSASEEVPTRLLARLWGGYVPLFWTYWGWGVAGGMACVVVIAIAEAIGPLWLQLVVALLALGYIVLTTVAIWRSAGRYDGPTIWAIWRALPLRRVSRERLSGRFSERGGGQRLGPAQGGCPSRRDAASAPHGSGAHHNLAHQSGRTVEHEASLVGHLHRRDLGTLLGREVLSGLLDQRARDRLERRAVVGWSSRVTKTAVSAVQPIRPSCESADGMLPPPSGLRLREIGLDDFARGHRDAVQLNSGDPRVGR